MKRKIIASVLIILLINFSIINVFAATKSEVQSQLNEKKEELDDVQTQKSSVLSEIGKLDESIENTEREIADLNSKISDLNDSIAAKNKEIKQKEKEYKEKDQLLQDRLVALYEAGETRYLDLLLSSGSITDFISNFYLVEQLTECDTEILNSIEKAKTDLETAKKDLETKKNELNNAKKELDAKNTKLKNEKTEKQAKVDTLSEEERAIQNQIDDYNAEIKKIEEVERAAAEAARRKAAEEAARRQSSSSSSSSSSSGNSYSGSTTGTGSMTWPVPGYPIMNDPDCYFGYRIHPIYGTWRLHSGIDIAAPVGAQFVAADDGVVILAEYNGGYGNCVVISHGNGITTRYAHGTSFLVSEGETVSKGTPVLTVGSTGDSTGPHAHFEVRVNGVAVNPLDYV